MSKQLSISAENRVLILAPTTRDAEISRALLHKSGVESEICPNLHALNNEISAGAAALLLTEEVITTRGVEELVAALKEQPSWSDLPIVMLMRAGGNSRAAWRVLDSIPNITLLERPAPMRSVVSAVQAAVRGRLRQYQIRDQMEEIRHGEERFRQLANSIPQLAWMAKPDGIIFWYNDRWHQYTGTTPEQMEESGWQSVLDPKERPRVLMHWKMALEKGEPWEDTFPLRRHDGEFRWHLSRANPVRNHDEQIIMWFGTNTDVTEQRGFASKLQQLVEVAERANRIKDEFLATLSHELRTPLNAMFGWIQLLKQEGSDPEIRSEGITVLDRNVRVQTQLIEDLLDMSRIISGKVRLDVQRVELPEVINAAIESVRPAAVAKSIRLEKVLDSPGDVSGDPGRLQQVLWNLLTNAIKFTPKGGTIQLLSERVNSHVEISVSDNGEGIDPAFLPRIFERFSQEDSSTKRQHGGLGLGLSIVKNLVEMHGGIVKAQSGGIGKGAMFTIHLPLRAARNSEEEEAHPRTSIKAPSIDYEKPRLNGIKVLVLDDEPDARDLVKRFLLQCGAIPALAASVAEAEKLMKTFDADVILSDIGMPDRDGYDFIRAIRKLGIKTPAVALTAFARAEDRIRSTQAGYQAHLPKPVEPAELLAVVASLAGRVGEKNGG